MVETLSGYGYQCKALGAAEALSIPASDTLLVLIRAPLEGVDFDAFMQAYRSRSVRPVVALCDDREAGLKAMAAGADDFVCVRSDAGADDPGVRELLGRIAATLRAESRYAGMSNGNGHKPLRLGDLSLDERANTVAVRGEQIPITQREFALLRELLRSSQRVPARTLLEAVWGDFGNGQTHYVHVYVSRLRRTLADANAGLALTSRRGQGYALEETNGV